MIQEWKPGRLKKTQYLDRPLRELTQSDTEFYEAYMLYVEHDQGFRERFLHALWCPDSERVKNHKRQEYKFWFYNEGRHLKTQPARRWLSQPSILGWDIFWAIDDAKRAGRADTYEGYISFVREQAGSFYEFYNVILELAISLLDEPALDKHVQDEAFDDWLIDITVWYANSFFYTPWAGAKKELIAESIIRPLVEEYEDLKLVETTEVNDMRYMVDFVIIQPDGEGRKAVAGFSVKGASYYYASLRGNSKYQKQGESREQRGQKLFRQETGAVATVVIADPESPALTSTHCAGPVRAVLMELEAKGKIVRKRKYYDLINVSINNSTAEEREVEAIWGQLIRLANNPLANRSEIVRGWLDKDDEPSQEQILIFWNSFQGELI